MTQVALSQLLTVTTAVAILATFESLKAFERVALGGKGAPFGSTNVRATSSI